VLGASDIYVYEVSQSRLYSGNAYCRLVHKLLSSSLLFNTIRIKIHRTTMLPVVLYGCETWSLTSGEAHRLSAFHNRVLRRIFGSEGTR